MAELVKLLNLQYPKWYGGFGSTLTGLRKSTYKKISHTRGISSAMTVYQHSACDLTACIQVIAKHTSLQQSSTEHAQYSMLESGSK